MSVYHYIYYRLYRLFEKGEFSWWSDVKGWFILAAIEMMIFALINFKLTAAFDIKSISYLGKEVYIFIIAAPPVLFNYFFFQYNDRWKPIVKHFDKASKQEKRKMNIQMAVVLVLVGGLVAFLFSFTSSHPNFGGH